MDFAFDRTTLELRAQLEEFFDQHIYPAEHVFEEQILAQGSPWDTPPIMEELKAKARDQGLWNLFLPPRPSTAPASPTCSTRRCVK